MVQMSPELPAAAAAAAEKPRRVCVTGCAGFIGSHLAARLLKRGDTVIGLDNYCDYYDPKIKRSAVAMLQSIAAEPGSGEFLMFDADIRNAPQIETIFQTQNITHLCHLAAQAGVRYSIDHGPENVQINVQGTVNMLDLAVKFKVPVALASSSSVYGSSASPPFAEDERCDKPVSPYAATKRCCELLAHAYHHIHKHDITCLRFFTVYGPRGRPDMAAFKFIDRISRGEEIQKFGDGSAIRDFTYVDDIVNGVVAAIDRPQGFRIVNLGGGCTYTLNQFIEVIEKHVGKTAKIHQMDIQPGDVMVTSADQADALKYLNFKPQVSLDEGIRRTVEWYNGWIQDDSQSEEETASTKSIDTR